MHGKITCLCLSPLNQKTLKTENPISQELLERVERYLDNTMSKQEHDDFELQLQTDTVFRTKVEEVKTLLMGVENQSLKELLDDFHKDIPESEIEKHISYRFSHWRKFAAAAVILIAVTSFWWFDKPQNEQLYDEYFTPDPGLPTVMGNSDNFDFYDAMVDYKQGHYKTAIEKWEVLQTKKSNKDTLNYFIGVAHLANENDKNAISFLEKSTQNIDFTLLNDAHYYLGLAYLKEGNIEKAKANFKLSNHDESKVILNELND